MFTRRLKTTIIGRLGLGPGLWPWVSSKQLVQKKGQLCGPLNFDIGHKDHLDNFTQWRS